VTPENSRGLDRSLAQGIAWTGGVKWVTQFVSWAVTLVVARLLSPADYGLFGMAMVYLGVAMLMSEAGLLPVVIQPKELDRELAARLGGLGLAAGTVVGVASVALSGVVAWFFHEPRVQAVIIALSFTFVLRGAQVLPRGLLIRDLDFRRVAWLDAMESMGAALATVVLAIAGYGYWALVGGALFSLTFSTIFAWLWRPHRIVLTMRGSELRAPLKMGWQVMVSQFAWYAYCNADFAVVGRVLGKAALGAYGLAWTIANVPVDRITSLVGRVAAPVFSAVQHDRAALRRYLYALTEGLALITLPACAGLALIADVLVRAMLVPAWNGAVVPLRILALYAAFRCVTSIHSQVLIFTGHARRNMNISIVAAVALPICFVLASRWGTTGVAAVWLTVYPLVVGGAYVYWALEITGLSLTSYLQALAPAVGGTAAMAVALTVIRALIPDSVGPVALLVILVTGGAAVYLVAVLAVHGHRLRVAIGLLRGRQERVSGPSFVVGADVAPEPEAPRLLLISWHFPPDSAVGALRWEKFARLAAERGWRLDVVMRDTKRLAGRDPARLRDLPPSTRVFEVPLRQSLLERATNLLSRIARAGERHVPAIRAGLSSARQSVPRGEVKWSWTARDLTRSWHAMVDHLNGDRWARDAARAGRRVLEPGVHRMIVSCGPPHWAHRAALRLARESGLPFAADLRDPWSLIQRLPEHLATPATLRLAKRDESRVVRRASLVVTNTERARDAMRAAYPEHAAKVIDVPNGYDDDPLPSAPRSHRFVVAYAGTIYLDRDPRPLCRAAARVIRERSLGPEEFGLEFMGDVGTLDGVRLEDIAREEGVADFVRIRPQASREKALEFLAGAALLVVLPQDSDAAIPAKLFDYVRFPAWVLVCGPVDGAARTMVGHSGADGAAPGDTDEIARVMLSRFDEFSRGVRPLPIASDASLSRRARAAKLFGAIEAITGAPPAPRQAAMPDARDGSATPSGRRTAPRAAGLRAAIHHGS
jgi:O-antigen/teichoic acid export membrane protein/glycosyltransferase involved in cell wall biosynthesis